jgi:hypothetical protein
VICFRGCYRESRKFVSSFIYLPKLVELRAIYILYVRTLRKEESIIPNSISLVFLSLRRRGKPRRRRRIAATNYVAGVVLS